MKKPVEAIERMRKGYGDAYLGGSADWRAILAYLDSLPDWPADLTRERLEELARLARGCAVSTGQIAITDALRRLAELAPRREKRKYELWKRWGWPDNFTPLLYPVGQSGLTDGENGWRKVGEAEIDA